LCGRVRRGRGRRAVGAAACRGCAEYLLDVGATAHGDQSVTAAATTGRARAQIATAAAGARAELGEPHVERLALTENALGVVVGRLRSSNAVTLTLLIAMNCERAIGSHPGPHGPTASSTHWSLAEHAAQSVLACPPEPPWAEPPVLVVPRVPLAPPVPLELETVPPPG
jgi:hypothetical protein